MSAFVGDWPEVDRLVCDLRGVAARLADPEPLSFILKAAGYCAYQRGDFATAEAAFAAVEDILDAQAGPTLHRGPLGLAQLAAGKRDQALATMARREGLLRVMPVGNVAAGPLLVCLAEMALALDDRPRLSRCYDALLPFAGQCHWFLVDRVLGESAVVFGDWAAAERHLGAAEAHAAREDMRPEQALLLSARAELELARGGSGSAMRARQALAAAQRSFEALGMAAELRRTRNRLRNLPPQPGAAPTRDDRARAGR
jgi:hypothetical protein